MKRKALAALLDDAEINAAKGWETDFVASLRDITADGAELTEPQLDKLTAIALGINSTQHVRF